MGRGSMGRERGATWSGSHTSRTPPPTA
jgi:hypothetical protein